MSALSELNTQRDPLSSSAAVDTPPHARRGRIAMALYGDLTFDSRVRREARSLALAGYDVTIVCLAAGEQRDDLPDRVRVVVLPSTDKSTTPGALNPFRAPGASRLRAIARGVGWMRAYIADLRAWGRQAVREAGPVDAWHAHDFTGLAAVAPARGASVPVIYDVHDLMVETGTAARLPGPARSLVRRYERRLAQGVAAFVTVNGGLADVLRKEHRAERIEIVHNCPDRWSPPDPRPTWIRDAAGIPADAPVVLYHGGISSGRGIEPLMEAILQPSLEDAHLVLLGFGERREAFADAARDVRFRGRVHVLDAVLPDALLPWVASADCGAVLHPRIRLNDLLKTPNKLFECLAAGVPVVGSDFPLMREIVLADPAAPLGALCDPSDVPAIAAALRSILDLDQAGRDALRRRCLVAAQTRWNWESEVARLIGLYGDLIGAP